MFRIFFNFLIVAICAGNLNAQEWVKSYGGIEYDDAIDMVIDANGNSYTVGFYSDSIRFGNGISLNRPGEQNGFVAKFNSQGICQWAQSISSISFSENPTCVALDSNGNTYVGGCYRDSTYFGNGVVLPKVDTISHGRDPYIAKYNSNGECQWAKSLSSRSNLDFIDGIAIDANGNAYLIGKYFKELTLDNGISLTSAQGFENFIAKYNSNGECQWANRLGSLVEQYGEKSITSDSDGNFYIAGVFRDSVNFGNDISVIASTKGLGYFVKYNSNGVCQWAKSISGTSAIGVEGISRDAVGNFYLLGNYSDSVSINNDITLTSSETYKRFVAKYNAEAQCQWAKNIGESNVGPYLIFADSIGNTYLAGSFHGTAIFADGVSFTATYSSDFFVAKYDTMGSFLWGQNICGNGRFQILRSITVDKEGKVYLFGEYDGEMLLGDCTSLVSKGSYDCFFAKFNPQSITYPSLKYPKYNAQTMSINSDIEWHSAIAATGYRVQVSTSNNFDTKLVDEVVTKNTTSRNLSDLKYNTQYYWRVQKLVNNDTSAWSPAWTFSTGYDPNAQIWAQSFANGVSFFYPIDLAFDSSNNYFVAGQYNSNVYLGNGKSMHSEEDNYQGFVSKFNSFSEADWALSQYTSKSARTFSVVTDSKGYVYITGYYSDTVSMGNNITLTSNGDKDGYFAKYTPTGECLWAKSIGGVSDDCVGNLIADKNGNVCVVGNFSDTISLGNGVGLRAINNKPTQFVAKYDTDGKCLRANTFGIGNFNLYQLALDYENSLYICGSISTKDTLYFPDGKSLHSAESSNSFIVKYDSSGRFIRAKSYPGFNSARSIATDSFGNIYMVGSFVSQMPIENDSILLSVGHPDGYIIKYNLDGDFLWAKQLSGVSDQDIKSIKLNSNGEVFVFGTSSGTITFGEGIALASSDKNDIFLAKLNSEGKCLWAKCFGSKLGVEELSDAEIDKNNNIFLIGTFNSKIELGNGIVLNTDNYTDRFLVKYKALYVNAPTLVAPLFDTKNISPNSSFTWSSVKDVNSYRVQVSTTNDFTALTVNEVVSNTTAKFTSLLDSTKYFWRVKGLTNTDSTDWSVTWSFTTDATADVVESNSSTISISPQPVRNEAVVTYSVIPTHAGISIELYDLKGTIVATYSFTSLSEGTNKLRFDVSKIPSGMYNVIIKSGADVHQAKMIKVD